MKAATAWSIGQIGHHTPEHAKAVATANVLPKLLELYMDAGSSEDLQAKVRAAALQVHVHSDCYCFPATLYFQSTTF